jgi:hypothetical protein
LQLHEEIVGFRVILVQKLIEFGSARWVAGLESFPLVLWEVCELNCRYLVIASGLRLYGMETLSGRVGRREHRALRCRQRQSHGPIRAKASRARCRLETARLQATVTRNTSRHLILFSSCDMSRHVTHAAAQSVVGSKLFAVSQKQRQAERRSKVRRACQLATSPRRAPRAALASLSKPRAVVTARRGEHIGTRRGTRRARRPVLVAHARVATRRPGIRHASRVLRLSAFSLREGPRQ